MEDQTLYQLALSRVPGIGVAYTKKLIDYFGRAKSVFHADRRILELVLHRRELVDAVLDFRGFQDIGQELDYLRKNEIRILFYKEPGYPSRLVHIPEAPALIFYQGNADLNAARAVGIAGTRKPTPYGIHVAQKIVEDLAGPDLLVVSGLAFGIDAAAHTAALNCKVPTIGVLGSGLGRIQPREHWGLARTIRRQGGLVSSFSYNSDGTTYSFPVRNKLIAGLCDVLVVIESGIPGGSLSAAASASSFKKVCFAVPGRLTDEKSQGCLKLIHEATARPFLSAAQLSAAMGWEYRAGSPTHQRSLELRSTAALQHTPTPHPVGVLQAETAPAPPLLPASRGDDLLALLRGNDNLSFDDLHGMSHLSIPALSYSLLDLELRGIIRALPGKRYHVVK